jgi:hypothetical protein
MHPHSNVGLCKVKNLYHYEGYLLVTDTFAQSADKLNSANIHILKQAHRSYCSAPMDYNPQLHAIINYANNWPSVLGSTSCHLR